MTFYQQNNIGLVSWYEENNENFLVARGSMFQETEFNGLELLRFDPLNSKSNFEKLGGFESGISFHCINWSNLNPNYPKGIITGGLKDGSLVLFDAAKIMQENPEEATQNDDAIIASFELYQNEDFYCMEYNPFKSTLLATGGHEIFIVNFEKGFNEPEIIIPQANQAASDSIITSIAWNKARSVQHILASAQDNGRINIIDLKLKKNIFSFSDGKDHVNRRNVGIAWNPSVATQIAVAFDYDDSGVQIWDLRNNKIPLKKINTGKIQNVHSITWSPYSKTTLLMANKMGDFFEYNLENDVFETHHRNDFRTLYSKYSPIKDTFYAVSEEGEFLVHSKDNAHLQSLALKNCPSSLKAKTQISSSLSGSGLITFNSSVEKGVYHYTTSLGANSEFPNRTALEKFEKLANDSDGNPDKYSQSLIKDFKQDKYLINLIVNIAWPSEKKLHLLDMDLDAIPKLTETITGKVYGKSDKSSNDNHDIAKKFGVIQEDEALDFFSDLGKKNEEQESNNIKQNFQTYVGLDDPSGDDLDKCTWIKNRNWNKGFENLIKKNILLNNYEAAIDLALKANRIHEAFVIAFSHPTKKEQLQKYLLDGFDDSEGFYSRFLNPLITKNYDAILNGYTLDEWHDILTFIIKNIPVVADQTTQFTRFISRLKESPKHERILKYVYLISGKIEDFINHLFEEPLGKEFPLSKIVSNFEILYLLKMKLDFSFDSQVYERYLIKLVLVMVENEQIQFAYELLNKFGNEKSEKVRHLQNLMYSTYSTVLHTLFYKPAEIKKHEFIFPKRQKPKEFLKPGISLKNVNPFGKPIEQPRSEISSTQFELLKPAEETPKRVIAKTIGVPPKVAPVLSTLNPMHLEKPAQNQMEYNEPPKQNIKPPLGGALKTGLPVPQVPVKTEVEQSHEQSKPQIKGITQGQGSKFSGPFPMPVKVPITQVQTKTELPPSIIEKSDSKAPTPPPFKTVGSFVPPQQGISKGAPPPMSNQKPPPNITKPVISKQAMHQYDEQKVKTIVEFIEKTPEVLRSIEPNQTIAGEMYQNLQSFAHILKITKSIEKDVIERFYNFVYYIEENRLLEASQELKLLFPHCKGELTPIWNVFDRILKYLL